MIIPYRKIWPKVHETAFVAPSADIIGNVILGELSSVWFQCVIRGDVHFVSIGKKTNIQDHCTLHVTRGKSPLRIGDEVTVAHRALLHGCTIGNRVLVGMGAIVMDDVEIGEDCLIGAGALVTKGTQIPPKSLVFGAPAQVIRSLKEDEILSILKSAENYVDDSKEYQGAMRGAARIGTGHFDLGEGDSE
jgi:gamma-carbonic anhydrase